MWPITRHTGIDDQRGMADNRRGAILLIMSAAIFTADVTVLRYLSPDIPFVLIIFFRSLLQLLIVTAYIKTQANAPFMSPRWPMLVTRGVPASPVGGSTI